MTPVLFLYLLLTFAISCWNAYASGAYLTESKIIGGFTRFITWCGLVMSAVGFTWVYLTILALLGMATHKLTPEQAEILMKLGYLVIFIPLIGSGFGIWAYSVTRAYRTRKFGDIAVGGWNTYAQFHNTWQAASEAPGFFSDVVDFFAGKNRKSSKDSGAALLIILLVVLAVCGGAITTGLIARWADRKIAIDVRSAA